MFLYSLIWIIYSTNLINAQKFLPNTTLLDAGDLGTKMVSGIGTWLDAKTLENQTSRNEKFLSNAKKDSLDPKVLEQKKTNFEKDFRDNRFSTKYRRFRTP